MLSLGLGSERPHSSALNTFKRDCSLFFDGTTNEYVAHGDVLDAVFSTGEFTILTSLRRVSAGSTQYTFGKWLQTGNNRSFAFRFNADNTLIVLWSNDGSSAITTTSVSTFSDITNFHSQAMRVSVSESSNNDRIKVYDNGSPVTMGAPTGTVAAPFDGTGNLVFANLQPGSNDPLHGYLHQYYVIDRALSDAEIAEWSGGGQPKSAIDLFGADVVLAPNIDEATFSANWTVPDDSASSLDGTSTGLLAIDRDCNETPYS